MAREYDLFVGGARLMPLLDKMFSFVSPRLLEWDRAKVIAGEECEQLFCSCLMCCGLRVRLFFLVALR